MGFGKSKKFAKDPYSRSGIVHVLVNVFGFKGLCLIHVIWTERGMTNLVLNVCFDVFSRHENQI